MEVPNVCRRFSINIPVLDCVECCSRKDIGLGSEKNLYCPKKEELGSPLRIQAIRNKISNEKELGVCKPCRIDLLKCDIGLGLGERYTIHVGTNILVGDTDPQAIVKKDSISQSDDSTSEVEEHLDSINQSDGSTSEVEEHLETMGTLFHVDAERIATDQVLAGYTDCKAVDHGVKNDSFSRSDDFISNVEEHLETVGTPVRIDTELITEDQVLKTCDRFTHSKESTSRVTCKEPLKIVGNPTTVDIANICRPCTIQLTNVLPKIARDATTIENKGFKSSCKPCSEKNRSVHQNSDMINTDTTKDSRSCIVSAKTIDDDLSKGNSNSDVQESGARSTPVANAIECTPCSVRLKLLEMDKCCAALKKADFANLGPIEAGIVSNRVTVEEEKDDNFDENVQPTSDPCAEQIKTVDSANSMKISKVSDSIPADFQASLMNVASRVKKRSMMPSLVSSYYTCKPCSVSIKRLKLGDSDAEVLNADGGGGAGGGLASTRTESGENSPKPNASPFSLAEHYIPRLLKVRYLNRTQSPLLPMSANRNSSSCSTNSSDTNDTEVKKSSKAGTLKKRSQKRHRKGLIKQSRRRAAREKHHDTDSDFSLSEREVSSDLESSSCENETNDNDFPPVRSSRKKFKGRANRPLDAKKMKVEEGSDGHVKSEGRAATTNKTCTDSKNCFRCPYCPTVSSNSYKYLNNMITHVYAKHKDVGVDEVKKIIAKTVPE